MKNKHYLKSIITLIILFLAIGIFGIKFIMIPATYPVTYFGILIFIIIVCIILSINKED